jgi:hypothetical protein
MASSWARWSILDTASGDLKPIRPGSFPGSISAPFERICLGEEFMMISLLSPHRNRRVEDTMATLIVRNLDQSVVDALSVAPPA